MVPRAPVEFNKNRIVLECLRLISYIRYSPPRSPRSFQIFAFEFPSLYSRLVCGSGTGIWMCYTRVYARFSYLGKFWRRVKVTVRKFYAVRCDTHRVEHTEKGNSRRVRWLSTSRKKCRLRHTAPLSPVNFIFYRYTTTRASSRVATCVAAHVHIYIYIDIYLHDISIKNSFSFVGEYPTGLRSRM